MSTATKLITAEEFARMPDSGTSKRELVRGEIVERNLPKPRHGQICARIAYFGLRYVEDHDVMHVFSNDAGVITDHEPDTVRGPDVWFITYDRLPKGRVPDEYLDIAPDIAFEVISSTDRWTRINHKIGEYLKLGVSSICVLDPEEETLQIFLPDNTSSTLSGDDELAFPDLLPEFAVPVHRFFE